MRSRHEGGGHREGGAHLHTPPVPTFLPALVIAVAAAFGCGGNDSDGGDGAAVNGERCPQPGFTETGCSCDNGGVGSRNCAANSRWTACSCRPPRDPSACDYEGQAILCDPCPGMLEGRMTTCPASLIFDCSCDGAGAAGASATVPDAGAGDAG